ncbi:MAG: hypothetical protein AAF593_00220 [Planctomycetota bacterium]
MSENETCNDFAAATYCPEDNKLRIYCGWVERSVFEELRAAGYRPTPKQSCDFVATWSIKAEDLALSMLEPGDDIGDEDQSPEDRAADRAERFAVYREKRRAEAHGLADRFDATPSAYGHQNAAKAERAARKRDAVGVRACSQWSKAEYWERRTAGVIANALHKSDARTRRRRIKRLEGEAATVAKMTAKVDSSNPRHEGYRQRCQRLADHLGHRLAYEHAMLAEQGGAAADVEMIPGGFIGSRQIHTVNRSRTTGRVVSVGVWAAHRFRTNADGSPVMGVLPLNIEGLPADAYRLPTPEELVAFKASKAKRPAAPKLLNPSREDADRLQVALNDGMQPTTGVRFEPREIIEMTAAQFSAYSKRSDSYTTLGLFAGPRTGYVKRGDKTEALCKVRAMCRLYGSPSLVFLTDKPAKPLPDWSPIEAPQDVEAVAL